jgi:hypothetical protein
VRPARALLAVVAALGGCGTTATPEQDLGYARWARCGTAFARLERVDLDGRITFQYSDASERGQIVECLAEAGRAGPPLPEPRGVRPPGGP